MAKALLDGKLMFPSEYVAAVEFAGKDVTLTIKQIEIADLRMVDNTTQKKPVLHFVETPKKLVLNKTNANQIAELHGSEARKWVGKRITLYPTKCQSFGKTVDCVRIRPIAPRGKAAAVEAAAESNPEHRKMISKVHEFVTGCSRDDVEAAAAKLIDSGEQWGENDLIAATEARVTARRQGD